MRLCVFCGSSNGRGDDYLGAAHELGERMAARNIGLVYGGASIGVMGAVADAVLGRGGEVIGVIPKALADREVAHEGLSELHVVSSMHERKALMAQLCDAFVAMPGGLGTLEELFEVWTWAQLGIHNKPIGLLNVADFYTPLESFLDGLVAEEFVRPAHRQRVHSHSDVAGLLKALFG